MNIDLEKDIVQSLSSLYPLQEFEEKAIQTILDALPSAEHGTNLAEVGTDCISRQTAIDALGELPTFTQDWSYNTWMYTDDVYNAIKELPPIQPKRGRWIKLDMHRGMADHKCSVCEQECYVPTCMGEPMYAYCPNCGAKMEVNNDR